MPGTSDEDSDHSDYSGYSDYSGTKAVVDEARNRMMDTLSSDVRAITEWGRQNRVEFNLGKTQACRFSHKRSGLATSLSFIADELQETSNLKVLGTNVSNKLLWFGHVMDVMKNAAKSLGFLRRCSNFVFPEELATIKHICGLS